MLRYWPIILGLVYLVFPYDLLPDYIPRLGRIDDLLLLAYLYWAFMRKGRRASTDERSQSSGGSDESRRAEYDSSEGHGQERRPQKDPYRVLGTTRSASLDEIKSAYRTQANRYHPDKVSHLGEEFQALAKEKFQEIQWAYEQLVKEKEEDLRSTPYSKRGASSK